MTQVGTVSEHFVGLAHWTFVPLPAAGRRRPAQSRGTIGAKIRTFLVKHVLQVVVFPTPIPNILRGQRLILALMV